MLSLLLNQEFMLFVTSDFPAKNPHTQNRTILIQNR